MHGDTWTSRHSDDYVAGLGHLTMASWRLEKLVHEVGRGLGVLDSETDYRRVVAHVEDMLAAGNLPPWRAPSATPEAIRSWLGDAVACLAERDVYVRALARGTSAPSMSAEDYGTLADRCHQLTGRGGDLCGDLALVTASGTRLFGYHAIVRSLYAALTDPQLSPDVRPGGR